MSNAKRRFLYASVAVLTALLCGVLVLMLRRPGFLDRLIGLDGSPHPTDDELMAIFHRHHADFERVRDMMLVDKGLLLLDKRRTVPADPEAIGVPRARITEYRKLLDDLGIRGGIAISEDRNTIELTVSSRGFVTHGSRKGYMYTTDNVEQHLVGALETLPTSGVGSGMRRIEGNWYLFYEGD